MHFTLVFSGPEHRDLSYGLVFIPCPVWVAGDREVLNLDSKSPHLQAGAVARLVKKEAIEPLLEKGPRRCAVVIHPEGNGTEADLATLLQDLSAERFTVSLAGSA